MQRAVNDTPAATRLHAQGRTRGRGQVQVEKVGVDRVYPDVMDLLGARHHRPPMRDANYHFQQRKDKDNTRH